MSEVKNLDNFGDKFRKLIKKIRYFFEAILVGPALFFFKIIGLEKSSNFGSKLAKFVGKKLPVHKLARKNINQSLDNLNNDEVEQILDGMWDNLGRIIGEFVHIANFSGEDLSKYAYFSPETLENINYLKRNLNGGLIFSAHLGNWEVGPKLLLEKGINTKTIYRPLNNKIVDDMTAGIRGAKLIPKSAKGNKQVISEIKNGNYVMIMADQRVADGQLVPFFGQDASTTTSIARLALKYNVPIIPARVIRIDNKFKFEVQIEKPIESKECKEVTDQKITALTVAINEILEKWIREYPSQWFWVHNRWKK